MKQQLTMRLKTTMMDHLLEDIKTTLRIMINLKYAMAEAPAERKQWYRGKLQEAENLYFSEVKDLNETKNSPEDNPALSQLTADAKEFDRQHDMEEIDPAMIPF